MKYKNASEVLPDKLLREIQKYVNGETIYIPNTKLRKKWGEGSGARAFFETRNKEIKEKFENDTSIYELSEKYCLSVETIKKIVYK